jgi:L-threonylcarbamoyladenylate synthase
MADPVGPAARALRAGGLVVYPTDTLWGLGARAVDRRAVDRLARVKARPPGLPISIAVSSVEEVERWAELRPPVRAVVRRSLPGPVTLLLPASPTARRRLAPGIVGPEGTVGVRVPDHPAARELARRVGPITATSANRHGRPPAATLARARVEFQDAVDAYLDVGPRPAGRPSRLLDLRGREPRVVDRS